MKVFLDSSALVKLYHEESESQMMQETLSQSAESLILSEIAKLEFHSAIWKKVRTGDLGEQSAVSVISFFQDDYPNYQWINIDSKIIDHASRLLMKHGIRGLRTLDAIQLASALRSKVGECSCLTFDDLLKEFFEDEGLAIFHL